VAEDLPPISRIKEVSGIHGSGTMIREMLKRHEDVSDYVAENVFAFIQEHHLYGY
jgi:nicotinic acid mononucleotide adenylyltransferase